MLIRHRDGPSRFGLIVDLKGALMRVALAGSDDVTEFRLVNDTWISDDCEVVPFEFPPGIAAHDQFRTEVAKALQPMKRFRDYLERDERNSGIVN